VELPLKPGQVSRHRIRRGKVPCKNHTERLGQRRNLDHLFLFVVGRYGANRDALHQEAQANKPTARAMRSTWWRRLFDKSSHEQSHVLFEVNFQAAIDDYRTAIRRPEAETFAMPRSSHASFRNPNMAKALNTARDADFATILKAVAALGLQLHASPAVVKGAVKGRPPLNMRSFWYPKMVLFKDQTTASADC